jgi:hypothetical protein
MNKFLLPTIALGIMLIFSATGAEGQVPNPGHGAAQIGPGTFDGGSDDTWIFPGTVTIGGIPSDPGLENVSLGEDSNRLVIETHYGTTQIGMGNTGWTHFYTDASNGFYFGDGIVVNTGEISSYDEDLIIRADYNLAATANQLYLDTSGSVGIGKSPGLGVLLDVDGDIYMNGYKVATEYWIGNQGYMTDYEETDPQVGTLTSDKWCTTDGTDIDCTTDAPTFTETDPQVGTLTSDKWCTTGTGGTDIDCTSDAPVLAESDPTWSGSVSIDGVIGRNGDVGIGVTSPKNKLDVEGGAVIGASYSGTNTAPANGLLVQGSVGIGTYSISDDVKLDIEGGDIDVSGYQILGAYVIQAESGHNVVIRLSS